MSTIKELSDIEFDARLIFEGRGMMNTCGLTTDEARELQANYKIAQANWMAARRNLESAVDNNDGQTAITTKIDDQFWLCQGYSFVDGVLRNEAYINNLIANNSGQTT